MQDLVLCLCRKSFEALAVRLLAMLLDIADCRAIKLRWCQLQLIALLVGALAPGPAHVPGLCEPERAVELQVDESGDARLHRPSTACITGDQAFGCSIEEMLFLFAQ